MQNTRPDPSLFFLSIGLYVDPMTPEVIPFYQQYGFLTAEPGHDSHLEMWLPIKTCIQVVSSLL